MQMRNCDLNTLILYIDMLKSQTQDIHRVSTHPYGKIYTYQLTSSFNVSLFECLELLKSYFPYKAIISLQPEEIEKN